MNTINQQADFIHGNRTGCLLIHGFGGTPADLGDLPERLAAQGYSILIVRLAGHGTTPTAFHTSRAEDWLASVEAGFDTLRQHCQNIVVVGFSLGGVLGLLLSQRRQFDGLVTIGSRVITIPSRSLRYAPIRMLLSLRDPSLAAAFQLHLIVQQAARILPMVQLPVLVMHGRNDVVVTHENAEAILTGVSSSQKELVWWENTGHQMLEHGQHREAIYQRIALFVTNIHEKIQQ
jgi:carboxylesterase